jgi:hypothetical protein
MGVCRAPRQNRIFAASFSEKIRDKSQFDEKKTPKVFQILSVQQCNCSRGPAVVDGSVNSKYFVSRLGQYKFIQTLHLQSIYIYLIPPSPVPPPSLLVSFLITAGTNKAVL